MSPSDYDDDDSPFSPAGDLEDDSLLDEVLMESYDEDDKGTEEDHKTNVLEDIDDEDTSEADDLDDNEEPSLEPNGR